MRVIRSLLWFIVGVLLALVSELSFASFSPGSTTQWKVNGFTMSWYDTKLLAAGWYCYSGHSGNSAYDGYDAVNNWCTASSGGHSGAIVWQSRVVTNPCPSNSTGTTTCTCNSGYNENATSGTTVCSLPCPADGTALGAYWMPEGTTLSTAQTAYNNPSQLHCMSNGCYAAPAVGSKVALGTYLVEGVTNYDITYSSLTYLGDKAYCNPGTSPSPIPAAKPTSTCATAKYLSYDANNNPVCYNADGTAITPTGPAVGCGDVSDSVPTVNGDGSTTVVTTVKDTCTGKSASTSVTYPSGTTAIVPPHATSIEGGLSPGGIAIGGGATGGGATGGGAGVDPTTGKQTDSIADFCAKNPTVDVCKTTSKGTAATVTGIYTPDSSGKTFASSIGDFKTTIQGSGLYSAATGFITAGTFSGSCSDLSVTFDLMGRSMTLDAGSYLCGSAAETLYTIMATGLLLMATLAAYKIAIL